jgi:hypothetical protein
VRRRCVVRNQDRDPARASEFHDGFLDFAQRIEI